MENIRDEYINKYQVTLRFEIDDEFMGFVPAHRLYINSLIEKNIIDVYTVSMESQRAWVIINARSKKQVEKYLAKSPLFKYWAVEIDEIFLYDGQSYRMPAVQLN
jgi:hypothetical protein